MPKSFVLNFEDNKPAPCAFVGSLTEHQPEEVEELQEFAVIVIDTSLLVQYIKEKYDDADFLKVTVDQDPDNHMLVKIHFGYEVS